jgi:hypothetical protein
LGFCISHRFFAFAAGPFIIMLAGMILSRSDSNRRLPRSWTVLPPARFHHRPGLLPLVWLTLLLTSSAVWPAVAASRDEQIAIIKAQMQDAIAHVEAIVNQPVTQLPRTPDMTDVSEYSPGWFHPGALRPDFDNVDVRATQQFTYDAHEYATSDLNPGVVFIGKELEFNAMTKFFYTDRSLPKKKLTGEEMDMINQFYRVIGRCQKLLIEYQIGPLSDQSPGQLAGLPAAATQPPADEVSKPEPPLTQIQRWLTTHKPALAALAGTLFILLVARRFLRRSQSN